MLLSQISPVSELVGHLALFGTPVLFDPFSCIEKASRKEIAHAIRKLGNRLPRTRLRSARESQDEGMK